MEQKVNKEKTLEKPAFLYHGSKHKGLEELEPRRGSYRDLSEGKLVFATPSLAMATIFMAESSHYGSGKFGNITYCYMVEPREQFIRNDRGGHI